MKIGILTCHRAANFGTALQAIASVSALREAGADAEIVDYRPECFERTLRLRTLSEVNSLRSALSYAAELVFRRRTQARKIEGFKRFLGGMPTSEPIYDKTELERVCSRYDTVVSGSDQIWNPYITVGDMTYFLPFAHPRKAAFASSFGTSDFTDEMRLRIAGYLEDFDFISVREKTAVRYIGDMIADGHGIVPPQEILDPTLLYGIDWWQRLSEPAELPKGGYILAYYMLPTPLLEYTTEMLSRKTGLPVVNIKPSKMDIIKRNGTNAAAAGPAEFISYFAGASYIVTNSFHGTAFSLNFGKPFIVSPLPQKNTGDLNSRITDILELTGMTDRWITTEAEADALPLDVDFTKAAKRLEAARAEAWETIYKIVSADADKQDSAP